MGHIDSSLGRERDQHNEPVVRHPIIRYNPCPKRGAMGLYSHYDGAHNHPVNRALHLIAIPVGFSSLIVVWFHWIIGLLLIPAALCLAWLGHLIEGNKPAFLTNPIHVLVAPVWMARKIFGGRTSKPDVSPPAKAI